MNNFICRKESSFMKVDFSISTCISLCIYKNACIYRWLLTLKGVEFGVVIFFCFSFLLDTDRGWEVWWQKPHGWTSHGASYSKT